MTQGDSSTLETLRVVIEADKQRLTQGLTAAVQETRQAGQQMGQGLRTGLTAGAGGLGGVGTQAGQQFGEGFKVGADGKLRDAKGRFVKTGQELGQGLADGLKQSSPAVDSAVTGLTSALSGGGAGGGIGAAFGRLTAGAGGLSASLTGIVGVAGPAGAAIAGVGAAAAAVIAPVNAAINVFSEFEYGLAKVSTLTDKTPQQLRGTGQEILRLSAEMGASFQSLNAGLYDILGAGVAGTESMAASLKFLEQAAKLAKAGATDTAVATDVLTSVMNAYKMSAEDAGDVSDKLFKAVDLGKMSFEQLAQSLGMVTAISSQAGVSLDEVLAALSTMTANGVQASSAVDYLRSMISAITKPSKEASGLAEELGIAFNEQALKGKGLTSVLQEVIAKTGGSTEKMGVLFGGVEAVTAATSIASGEFARMNENVAAIGNSSGTTATAYGKMASTVQQENDKLAANWQRLMAGMGEVFAPFKLDVLSGLNELLNKANEVLEKWMQAKRLQGAGNEVLKWENELTGKRDERRAAVDAIQDFKDRGQAVPKYLTDALRNIDAEIARLQGLIATAKAEQARLQSEAVATGRSGLAPGTEGPRWGGDYEGSADMPQEAGKFGYAFIHALTKTFTNDSRVASDCAIIAYELLNKLGVKIKGTAVQNAWVPTLEKNAKASGFQEVALKDARPGDLVIFKSGNGIRYGAGSGMHAGLIAGTQNGQLMVADNPGTQADGSDGITRVRAIGRDAPQATIYRAPTSPFAAGNKPTGAGTGSGAGGADDNEGPITAAQIVKAQQLLAAVEKAKKAMQADPKNNGLKIAYDAAVQSLNGWTAASKENARAAQAVRDSQTGAAKSASGAYIASSQELRAYGADALKLFKALEKAQASGSSQAVATAERNIALWIGESDAKKAVFQAESQAYRARQQQAEDARRQAERDGAPARTQAEIRAQEQLEKALRNTSRARLEQLAGGTVGENGLTLEKWKAARAEIERRDRAAEQSRAKDKAEDEKAAKEAEARAKEAAQRRARVAEAARQGDIALAKQEAERLEQMRDNDLRKAGDSAKKRREVELRYANDIYLAKKAIAEREYADAMRDAANGPAQNRAKDEKIAKQALDAALGKAEAEKNARLAAARQAEEAEDKAAKDRAAAREKEQAQLRARIADERRQLTESAARQELERVQELNKQELAAFKGNGAERLALIRRQAEDEYQARLAVARATRDRLLRESANRGGSNQAERDRQIRANFTQAGLTAQGQRDAAIQQATEQQTKAVQDLRKQYSALAESIRDKVKAGTYDADAAEEAQAAYAELERATTAAGLSSDRYLTVARQSAAATLGLGDAAVAAGERLEQLDADLEATEDMNVRAAQGASDLADELIGMGRGADAMAVLEGALNDVMDAAGRGESVGNAVSILTARIEKLKGEITDLDLITQRIRGEEAMWLAQNQADVPDVGDDYRQTADGGYEFGGDSTADAFLTAFTGESAGERLRSAANFALTDVFREAGQNAKEEFWGEFESELGGMSDDDLAALGADALRGILSGLGNDEALKGARDRIQGALNIAVDAQSAAAGWADLGAVLGQIGDGASLSAETISDRLIPELERIRDAATDPKLKEAAERAIGYLNSEIDATRELARLREQAALSNLDRRRASGQIGEGEYIGERQRLRLEQEEARYRLDIQGKSGKALELAEAQHQRNVAEIIYEGVDAQLALQNRLAEERLSITRRGQERELEARRQAGMPELEYIAERTRLAEQAAQDEFDARVKGLKKGSPEYLQAEQALQSKLADIRQRGQFDAADSLDGAVKQLQDSSLALASALGETERPFQNQIRLLFELKKKYPELTSQIDELIDRYTELQGKTEALQKFNKYADMVGAVAGQFSKLGDAVGGDVGANITGIGNALSLAVDVAKDIATGNYVAAAVKVIGSLIEALGGFAKARRQALEQQKQFNEQFQFINGDQYAKTFVKSRGFFADFFGGGPEVKQEIDKVGLMYAKSAEEGWKNGLRNGMSEALSQNDFSVFSRTLRESVFGGLKEGMLDLFLNDTLMKEIIAPAIKAWSDALKTPDTADDAAALAGIDAALMRAEGVGQQFYSQVAPKLQGLEQRWGIGQDGIGGSQGGSLFGAAPAAQFGGVGLTISLPDSFTRPFTEWAATMPVFAEGSATLLRAARLIEQTLGNGQARPLAFDGIGPLRR